MTLIFAFVLGLIGAAITFRADLRRRRLRLGRLVSAGFFTLLDMGCIAATLGAIIAILVAAPASPTAPKALFTPVTLAVLVWSAILFFLWTEGRHQTELQRPKGLVFAEWAILLGLYPVLEALVFRLPWTSRLIADIVAPIAVGGIVMAIVLPKFLKGSEEHRILENIATIGEGSQPEYAVPTDECPHPERWTMLDAQSAEIEVLEFLKHLVMTEKPELIVETGTFIGHSSMKMAEGLKTNGFGKIVTIEYDPAVYAKAKENIEASGLAPWIEYRNASSLDTKIDGQIDMLYSDSDLSIREAEVRRFLPQLKPRGLVLMHDASSSFKVVRDAALKLEAEGLLSVVLLSTPRGLVIAQKRENRS